MTGADVIGVIGSLSACRSTRVMRDRWSDPTQQDLGAKYARALSDEMELQARLEAGLPPAAAFHQSFASTTAPALPFIWAGYGAEMRADHDSWTAVAEVTKPT
jgi:hypothetical protein